MWYIEMSIGRCCRERYRWEFECTEVKEQAPEKCFEGQGCMRMQLYHMWVAWFVLKYINHYTENYFKFSIMCMCGASFHVYTFYIKHILVAMEFFTNSIPIQIKPMNPLAFEVEHTSKEL